MKTPEIACGRCVVCEHPLVLPMHYGDPLVCVCGARYTLLADYGWWGYTAEVYEYRDNGSDT